MSGCPLQHLHADRGVRSRVADHPRPDGGEPAVLVAADRQVDADRVALGVHQERLFTGQRTFHRPSGEVCSQRSLCLVGHVLLAAEGSAVRDQLDADFVGWKVEHCADLIAVVPDSLAARIDVESAVLAGDGQRGLGFEECLLDTLGLEHFVDHVGRAGQRGVGVAPGVDGA